MILSTILGIAIRLRVQDMLLLRTAAVLVGMVAAHNLVHAAPQVFQTLPGGWAETVLATTQPHTVVVRGSVISF
jgi:hypothetical protein